MARWFRSHIAKLENYKVQLLSDAHYRAWDSLLCVAACHDGVLPSLKETAFRLRKPEEETAQLIEALIAAGLFDRSDRGVEPHDWNDWQYSSDVSTERVKRFRQRTRNAAETPSESDSDSEPESDSEAYASGADAPDPAKAMFDEGVKLLTASGCKPKHARSIIGKYRAQAGDQAVLMALREARRLSVTEPISWLTARLAGKREGSHREGSHREGWNERRIREAQEAIQ